MASLEVVPSTQDLEAAVETQMYDEGKDGHLRAFKNTFSQVQDTFKDESMAPEVTPPVKGHQPEVTAPVEGPPPVEQVPEVAPPVEQVQPAGSAGATQEGESQVPPGQRHRLLRLVVRMKTTVISKLKPVVANAVLHTLCLTW